MRMHLNIHLLTHDVGATKGKMFVHEWDISIKDAARRDFQVVS